MSELEASKDTSATLENELEVDFRSKMDKTQLQVIIGTTTPTTQNENPSEGVEKKDNQDTNGKTNEDDSTVEQTNSKTSRELKLLLALSKEANLETNISHKRKSLDNSKSKEKDCSPKTGSVEAESKRLTKVAFENRNIRYPITAESELELELQGSEINNGTDNSPKTAKRKRDSLSEVNTGGATDEASKRNKKSSNEITMFKPNKDMFCWRCHREGVNISCETCPRSYHQRCLKQTISNTDHWPCPECVAILKAESTQTRSEAMKGMTLEHLCNLLKFAVNRMIQCQGSEPFLHPVNNGEFPSYKKYIIQPMDLTKLERNIKGNLYGSTQACEADAKWLLHNSIIFNSYQSKLTTSAKNIVKICKQEMAEIENCPSCYLNANTKKGTWFVEVCPKPHLLVWAKLKGFPYWPAKAMCTNSSGMVDVRFFGAHDRAWVHYKDCFLFSEKDPNTFKQKRYDIEKCVEELNIYIKNLQKVYGEFKYAPFRTLLDPCNELKQLQMFLPKYKSITAPKKKESIKNGSVELKAECKMVIKNDNLEKKVEAKESTQDSDTKENVEKQSKTVNIEAKENIPETEQVENLEKQSNPDEEAKLQDTNEIYKPTYDDNDTIMEGYGTDDDTNPEEIDLERRKTFIDKTSDQSINVNIEEDEDDTQVSSNISVDTSTVRGTVRTRGGCNNNTGKLKVLPRRTSEHELPVKRQSLDEMPRSPQKMSRRNSDQSTKSDSSRISNISDKINRVDISENMEVTLGNEDVGCISISENISSNKSDSSKGSDYSIENKRKPVQVDIENAEFTISPSNKLKIADKLMKRLSDGDSPEEGPNSDDSKKTSVVEKKSPTDLLIEKFKGVIEREIVDFGQSSTFREEQHAECLSTSEKDSQVSTSTQAAENVDSNKNVAPEKSDSSSTDDSSCAKDNTIPEKDHTTHDVNVPSEDKTNAIKSNPIEEKTNATTEKATDVTKTSVSSNDKPSQKPSDSLPPSNKVIEDNTNLKKNDRPEIVQALNSTKPVSTLSVKTAAEKKIFITNEPFKNKPVSNVGKESSQKEKQTITKKLSLIQPSITEFTTTTNNKEVGKENAKQDETKKFNEKANGTEEPKDTTTTSKDVTKKSVNRDVMNIIEEFDDSEEADLMESIEIDKTNIFNIIHSSLSETKRKDTEKRVEKPGVASVDSAAKKRKHSSDEISNTQSKLVKLVSIESILNKTNDKEKKNTDGSVHKTLQGKKMIRKPSSVNSTPRSSISRQSSVQEITMEDIKSEPETDDDFSESENLEAKKKYLSALNISEKVNDSEKQHSANEIRTRAKAEEKREKFRVVDNLTKVIDDVALNYSANNEGKEIRTKSSEKKSVVSQEGEIFVKSFAKIPAPKQRARKSFPMPSYVKHSPQFSILRKESSPSVVAQKKDLPKSGVVTTASKVISSTVTSVATPIVQPQKTAESGNSSSIPRVILLPPNQTIAYNGTIGGLTKVTTVVSAPTTTSIILSQPATSTITSKPKSGSVNLVASQNYIPQSGALANKLPAVNNTILNELLSLPIQTTSQEPPQQTEQQVEQTTPDTTVTTVNTVNAVETTNEEPQEDDFTVLNSILPDNVSRAVGDLLMRPPPRLKPRPPGMLSNTFDEGIPSSAGNVTSRINAVAHRLGDYLRGMLIETLEDLGKASNPEAKITSLQLEIEHIKHRHTVELSEMRKNICTVLKDIQKSIVEDREKIVDETRAACETETIKRVELAKSKQWCANCSKEAQFYCCWNTSYCDYPCQQKHWPQHLGKCTQNIEKTSGSMAMRAPGQQLILRPTSIPPKPGMGRVVAKPTKVYMNKAPGQSSTFKTQLSGSHLTVIETTPGNYELVGNGPIAVTGKILATTSNIFHSKFKTGNVVTVSSPSTSRTVDSRVVQRPTIVSDSARTLPTVSSTPATVTTNLRPLRPKDDSD